MQLLFFLNEDYIFSNKDDKITQLTINFDDGYGGRIVKLNEKIHVRYKTPGIKKLQVNFMDNNQNILSRTSEIKVEFEKEEIVVTKGNNLKSASRDISGSITGRSYLGMSATIDYQIILGSNNDILDKPIIVIEGFDPDDSFEPENWFVDIRIAMENEDLGYDYVYVN